MTVDSLILHQARHLAEAKAQDGSELFYLHMVSFEIISDASRGRERV